MRTRTQERTKRTFQRAIDPETGAENGLLKGYVIGRITDPVDRERIAAQGESLRLPDAQWTPGGDYHITLAAFQFPESDLNRTLDAIPAALDAIPAVLDGIDQFSTEDGYAVHLTARRQGEILALQRDTVIRLNEAGFTVSQFSRPDSFLPHVTLAYSPTPLAQPMPFAPFPVLIRELEISADHQPLKIAPMRNQPPIKVLDGLTHVRIVDPAQGEIEGYVAIWGNPLQRDSYNTWFDKERPPEMALDFLPFPVYLEHALEGVAKKEIVGRIVRVWFDEIGIRFSAMLDRSLPTFGWVIDKIRRRKYFTSSATASHLADFDHEGRFVHWTLVEVSLTENPSESRMPAVVLIRSNAEGLHAATREGVESATTGMDAQLVYSETRRANKPMTPEEMQAWLTTPEGQAFMAQYMAQNPAPGTETQSAQPVAPAATAAPAAQPAPVATPVVPAAAFPTQPAAAQPAPRADGMEEDEFSRSAAAILRGMFAAYAQQQAARAGQWTGFPPPTQPTAPPSDPHVRALMAQMQQMSEQLSGLTNRMVSAPPAAQQTPAARHGNGSGRIEAGANLRFAHMSGRDMAFAAEIMRSQGQTPSAEFVKHLTMKVAGDYSNLETNGQRVEDTVAVRSVFPSRSFRANEIMASDIAGQGLEWVGVYYSSEIWEVARYRRIFRELKAKGMLNVTIPDGAESAVIMLEGSDPVFYTAVQPNDVDATRRPEITTAETYAGTDKVTVTPGELRARIYYTDILNEDSLINLSRQLNSQLQEAAEDVIEYVFFNGDTATGASTNINLIDGTPAAAPSKPAYLVSDGALKLPLVTNTAVSRDAGTLAIDDWPLTLALLPARLWQDPERMVFVSDPYTYLQAIQLAQVLSKDVNSAATVETGVLNRVFGADYMPSGQIAKANAAGKISATPGNNTKGRLLALYARYWAMVNKRTIMIETGRDIDAGVNKIVASMRLAFRRRSNDAAALSYNITV